MRSAMIVNCPLSVVGSMPCANRRAIADGLITCASVLRTEQRRLAMASDSERARSTRMPGSELVLSLSCRACREPLHEAAQPVKLKCRTTVARRS